MDELIRGLKARVETAERARERYPARSSDWHFWSGALAAIRTALIDVEEAKRRMVDREPAWNLR